MPAIALLETKKIDVEAPVENTQGLRLLHYACYFGKVKALRALCESYAADIGSIDFRGQTPLHVAASSGEMAAIVYMCEQLEAQGRKVNIAAKDNALMTPLMSCVANSSTSGFSYMFFGLKQSLNEIDINGNTILHLAAKHNAVGVA